MSEHSVFADDGYSRAVKTAAIMITCGVLAGADRAQVVAVPQPVYDRNASVAFERCFEEPLNLTTQQAPTPIGIEPLTLKKDTDGRYNGEPGPIDPKVKDKIAGAAVRIDNGMIMGSGYLMNTKDSHGKNQTIVVTAAHVAFDSMKGNNPQNMRSLRVTDHNGKEASVLDDCYIYEDNGAFMEIAGHTTPARQDLAILRLSTPLGDSALTLSDRLVPRGDWSGYFYNFQSERKVDDPATYNGLALRNSNDSYRFFVLSGVQSGDNCELLEAQNWRSNCATEPGASGGVFADRYTGEVYGISTVAGPSQGERFYISTDLAENDNLTMQSPTGPDTGAWPILVGIVPAGVIATALKSPVYQG